MSSAVASRMASSSSTLLLKSLTTPSKMANALDWRKMTGSAILSLDIHADRIGIALAGHPSSSSSSSSSSSTTSSANSSPQHSSSSSSNVHFESLPLGRKGRVSTECRQRLQDLVHSHNVCGFVVSWPVQQDTGRMGAGCGRTLYTLEQLLESSSSSSATSDESSSSSSTRPIISPSRPACLWDAVHSSEKQPQVDSFGRSVAYSLTEPTGRVEHVASQEQYHQDQNVSAVDVWDDFCRQFWPDHVANKAVAVSSSQPEQEVEQSRSYYQEPKCELEIEDTTTASSLQSLAVA